LKYLLQTAHILAQQLCKLLAAVIDGRMVERAQHRLRNIGRSRICK
jgi:hypothetical protein